MSHARVGVVRGGPPQCYTTIQVAGGAVYGTETVDPIALIRAIGSGVAGTSIL